ncbi:MAG: hypothetical protein ACFCVD_04605 [Nodosilinea sp.]
MHQSWVLKVSAHDHLVQCAVVLSGLVQCEDILAAGGATFLAAVRYLAPVCSATRAIAARHSGQ